ncbi:hypothetical protein Tco_0776235 [Tanacetum coccineum]
MLRGKLCLINCMMMSHGDELLARYRGLLHSHHQYVCGINDKLASFDASFAKSKAKGKERKNKIKSLTKSFDNLQAEVAHLSAALNQATVLKAEKIKEILHLKTTPLNFASFFCGHFQDLVRKFLASDEFSRVQGELLSLAASAGFERGLSMHRTKDEFATVLKKMDNFMHGAQDRLAEASPLESTVTPASKSLELSANVDLSAFVVASKYNQEMVNAEVDESDSKMTDDTIAAKSGYDFVQGIFFALENDVELVEVGDGLVPFSAAGKEAAANSSRVYT